MHKAEIIKPPNALQLTVIGFVHLAMLSRANLDVRVESPWNLWYPAN